MTAFISYIVSTACYTYNYQICNFVQYICHHSLCSCPNIPSQNNPSVLYAGADPLCHATMGFFSGLIFAALCLLHVTSSAVMNDEVPECEELKRKALRMEQRDTLVVRLNEALKNVDVTKYSCPLERIAQSRKHKPGRKLWPDAKVFTHEEASSTDYGLLVRNAIQEWSSDLEQISGSKAFGCNYRQENDKTKLVCIVASEQ
ncbi:hypothetical protein Y032_0064g3511 [Ancylostoma ceylanicum]|uniref:Uncharacterized protein n=1 Tax=Ancylostoma ceylanicum TaxID=53326 RepID=A0A016U0W6_9BILA|nr:hypothetical protein Y032_0064g3511 [Ancylostoma ceylanicum]